jgi:hypothetical protein
MTNGKTKGNIKKNGPSALGLEIKYFLRNNIACIFQQRSVKSSEFKAHKLVLAQCDPKIKSNGMSLQFRALKFYLAEC